MDLYYLVPISMGFLVVLGVAQCTFPKRSGYMHSKKPPLSFCRLPKDAHNVSSSTLPPGTSMVTPNTRPTPFPTAPYESPLLRAEDLKSNNFELNNEGCVSIKLALYAFLTKRDGLPLPVERPDATCSVTLLQIAGMASRMYHDENTKEFQIYAKSLLTQLQELAKPEQTMPARRYRQEQIVKLLGKSIVYYDSRKDIKHVGILEGIVGQAVPHHIEMRIRGSDLWEVVANLSSLTDGTIKICEGSADEQKVAERANPVVDDDDKIINAG